MKLSKKAVIAIIVGVLVVAVGTTGIIMALNSSGGNGDGVYVQSISSILGYTSMGGMQNRYAGVVEAQETIDIEKDSNRTVSKVNVKQGDLVQKGDVLFAYDTDEADMALEQAKLELERIKNSISAYSSQIAELEKERKNAASSDKLEYTMQIQEALASMKTEEYNAKVKQLEIDKLETNAVESEVLAPISGVIRSYNESGMDENGNSVYMTLMATGDYRIKGLVNEQNVWSLSEGEAVTIRSRVDADKVWYGTISRINTEQTESNQNDYYAYSSNSGDSTTQSSKYPFYVTLDSLDGLMMGQHVYIELGEAQSEVEGIQLPSMYLVQEDDQFYAWVDKNGKLERRAITVGAYDELLGSYTIESGLALEDKIAFPDETLQEGNKTVEELPMADGDNMEGGDYMMDGDGDYMQDGDVMGEENGDDVVIDDNMVDNNMMDDGMAKEKMEG